MATPANINEIQSLITQAHEILILSHADPSHDSLAASLGLYLSLSAAGKNVTIACPTASTVEFNHLIGIDKVSQDLDGKNFIISLDYVEGAIEKVSYNISDNKFNLVIEPKPGAPAFTPEKVHYSNSSASPDLIFVIDCANFDQLGKFYQNNQDLYAKVTTVNIDHHANNQKFARLNLVDPGALSTSELVTFLIQNLGLPINEDVATNLLNGMDEATHNFSPQSSSGAVFEAAAFCLKAGGKREGSVIKQPPFEEIPQQAPADWLQPKIYNSKTTNKTSQDVPSKDGSTLL